MKKQIIKSACSHFRAKIDEAKCRMSLYLNPVGVGEHPHVLAEFTKAVEDYEHATSCLDIVEELE